MGLVRAVRSEIRGLDRALPISVSGHGGCDGHGAFASAIPDAAAYDVLLAVVYCWRRWAFTE